jgi:hypothetical protein
MKSTQKEKRAYHTPQVTDYGNVKQITMHVGNSGSYDRGGYPGPYRTH